MLNGEIEHEANIEWRTQIHVSDSLERKRAFAPANVHQATVETDFGYNSILCISFCVTITLMCTTACAESRTHCLESSQHGTFVDIPAGEFLKGNRAFYPEEQPTMRRQVGAFQMQVHEVTNREFASFVTATGYVTDAERDLQEDRLDAGSAVFEMSGATDRAGSWHLVRGATWRTPTGPGSDLSGKEGFPVVHLTHRDASAYATWAGGRLPTESEWEYAALKGLPDPSRSVSGAYDADGHPVANTWQGSFPYVNGQEDGFAQVAPVGCYRVSRLGLYDMIGNVWEWTATPYSRAQHTIKGGSFLCSENYCRRFRPAARQGHESDFSSGHIGFRIVRDHVE